MPAMCRKKQEATLRFNLHQIAIDLLSINILYRLYTFCDLKLDWKCQKCYCIGLEFILKIRYYYLLPVTLKYVLLYSYHRAA